VNSLNLGYKNQSVHALSGTSRCLFSKHINTVWAESTIVDCQTVGESRDQQALKGKYYPFIKFHDLFGE
jgi:hypothetical protein